MGCTESVPATHQRERISKKDGSKRAEQNGPSRVSTAYQGKWISKKNGSTIKIGGEKMWKKLKGDIVYHLRGRVRAVGDNSVLFVLTEHIMSYEFTSGDIFKLTDDPDKLLWYSSDDVDDFYYCGLDKLVPEVLTRWGGNLGYCRRQPLAQSKLCTYFQKIRGHIVYS
jgi:hypothetical protein